MIGTMSGDTGRRPVEFAPRAPAQVAPVAPT